MPRVTPEIAAKIVTIYQSGQSTVATAEQTGVSRNTVDTILRKNGVQARKPHDARLSPLWKEVIQSNPAHVIERYKTGETLETISDDYGVSVWTAREFLMKNGVVMRSRGQLPPPTNDKGEAQCTHCAEWKPIADFYVNNQLKSGRDSICKVCISHKHRQITYKIDAAQYDKICQLQDNKCAICGATPESDRNYGNVHLCVDHDHKTGAIRKLACFSCNQGLGHYADSPALLRKAAAYLEAHQPVQAATEA
jgi:hypothetical protein